MPAELQPQLTQLATALLSLLLALLVYGAKVGIAYIKVRMDSADLEKSLKVLAFAKSVVGIVVSNLEQIRDVFGFTPKELFERALMESSEWLTEHGIDIPEDKLRKMIEDAVRQLPPRVDPEVIQKTE